MSHKKEEKLIKNAYDSSIRYADSFIKKLWNDLKEDDPIFIIHSDHGDGFGEHGFYFHVRTKDKPLYEELIHIPFVIYNADIKGRVEKPVSLRSLAPTIMQLVGEENVFPCQSCLEGGSDWVISKVFSKGKKKVAVRTKEWKFIIGQKEEEELYYLKKNPYEQGNIVNGYPDLIKEMKAIIRSHDKQEKNIQRIREVVSKLKSKI